MLALRKDPFFVDLFDKLFETPSYVGNNYRKSNILDNENEYKVQLAVPGLTKDDVKITIKDSMLKISHEKTETDDKTFYFTNSFVKEYYIPDDGDEEKIKAKVENGILEIDIPKSKEKKNEKYIEIY